MSSIQRMPESVYWCEQECPFCHEMKIVITTGVTGTVDKPQMIPDRGYSFCNCKNIWFTNWCNIDKDVFKNSAVEKHHRNNKEYEKSSKEVLRYYLKYSKVHNRGYGKNKFLDLGSITPFILDEAKRLGFETTGCDLYPRTDFDHELLVGDFETLPIDRTFDIIWANHIFEHFHYPLKALWKCYGLLNNGGEMFIAMPDPFFIDFSNIYKFSHLLLRSHHIMWDMDSFIEEVEKVGFETKLRHRNTEVNVLEDMHLIFEKCV